MPQSTPNTLKIILANNNFNWVNALKAEKSLPPSKNTTFYQSPQSTKLLTKVLSKLVANLTSAMNFTPFITRIWMSDIFNDIDPEKLNSFLFQYQLYFYANTVQFSTDVAKVNFAKTYLTEAIKLV